MAEVAEIAWIQPLSRLAGLYCHHPIHPELFRAAHTNKLLFNWAAKLYSDRDITYFLNFETGFAQYRSQAVISMESMLTIVGCSMSS